MAPGIDLRHYTKNSEKMKTNKSITGIINFTIFTGMVTLGALSGYFTGNYSIGIHLGMGLGLMGIIVFGYLREKASVMHVKSTERLNVK